MGCSPAGWGLAGMQAWLSTLSVTSRRAELWEERALALEIFFLRRQHHLGTGGQQQWESQAVNHHSPMFLGCPPSLGSGGGESERPQTTPFGLLSTCISRIYNCGVQRLSKENWRATALLTGEAAALGGAGGLLGWGDTHGVPCSGGAGAWGLGTALPAEPAIFPHENPWE